MTAGARLQEQGIGDAHRSRFGAKGCPQHRRVADVAALTGELTGRAESPMSSFGVKQTAKTEGESKRGGTTTRRTRSDRPGSRVAVGQESVVGCGRQPAALVSWRSQQQARPGCSAARQRARNVGIPLHRTNRVRSRRALDADRVIHRMCR